jgi:radical SAM superfamily enzyme YgiQ (UPF0313 family)
LDPPRDKCSTPRAAKVCLITSLSIADFVDPELTAGGAQRIMPGNVGVLTLVAVLRELGYDPSVINLDRLFLDFRKRTWSDAQSNCEKGQFFAFVMDHLGTVSADVFGFSSICSSYPLTVRLAQEVKRLNPTAPIIFGGPQASVVDVATMTAFPWVDFVVRGEAEETFPLLLDLLSDVDLDVALTDLPGITFREDGQIVRNPNASVIANMDGLPLPAFDVDAEVRSRGSVYLEIGRGCPFTCTFCSTNDFFRRNFRVKSPRKMIEEMTLIKRRYGITNFSLIHDMYTVDRKKVVAFCEALLECDEEFTWSCSARTDCIDDELIHFMAKAGCRGIFFGIETGSERMQKVIKKKLDLPEARQRILCADEHEVKTAVALICGFPEESRDDLRETIHFFIDSTRFDHAEPQLSLLAPLAATPIYEEHKDELILDQIFSDMSHQGWYQDPADLELITKYPGVFPNFYAVPTRGEERSYLKELRDFVSYLALRFRWLPVALLQDSGDFLKVFDSWRTWLVQRRAQRPQADCGIVPYYCGREFRDDLIEFVRDFYIERLAVAPKAIAAIVRREGLPPSPTHDGADAETVERFDATSVPFHARNVIVDEFELDYQQLVQCLRAGADLSEVEHRKVTVAVCQKGANRVEVRQLSESSAVLMRLCDGRRTVEEVVSEFARQSCGSADVSGEVACVFGLRLLREEGLLQFSSRPSVGCPTATGAYLPSYSMPPELLNTQRPWPWATNSAGTMDGHLEVGLDED